MQNTYRKKRYSKKKYSKKYRKPLYKQVKSNKRAISKLKADTELKYIYGDVTQSMSYNDFDTNTVFFNTDIFRDEDTPAGGGNIVLDDRDKRIGNVINNKSLMIRGYFDNKDAPGTAEDIICRVIIGKFIQVDNPTFSANHVLEDSNDINTLYNIENNGVQNYKILLDHTFPMDHVNYQLIPFKARFLLKDRTTYEGQTTSQNEAAVRRNLYFIMSMSTASIAANEPELILNYKFAYTDQ